MSYNRFSNPVSMCDARDCDFTNEVKRFVEMWDESRRMKEPWLNVKEIHNSCEQCDIVTYMHDGIVINRDGQSKPHCCLCTLESNLDLNLVILAINDKRFTLIDYTQYNLELIGFKATFLISPYNCHCTLKLYDNLSPNRWEEPEKTDVTIEWKIDCSTCHCKDAY